VTYGQEAQNGSSCAPVKLVHRNGKAVWLSRRDKFKQRYAKRQRRRREEQATVAKPSEIQVDCFLSFPPFLILLRSMTDFA